MFEKSMNKVREGTVTMPLGEYDNVVSELNWYRSMFTIEKSWNDELCVKIDKEKTFEIGKKIFKEKGYQEEGYSFLGKDRLYNPVMTIAEPRKEEEEAGEDEEEDEE